jgi:hypothetical protein
LESCHVWVRETNANEPLMTHRNQTGVATLERRITIQKIRQLE